MATPFIDIHTHHGLQCSILVGATLHPVMGIHPWQTAENVTLPNFEQAIAIGEIGLDYSPRILATASKESQRELFARQVHIATKLQKPMVIHSVAAQADTLDILSSATTPWVWHGFAKGSQNASQILRLGPLAYLSFGARLLTDPTLQNMVREIPISHIFLETDTDQNLTIEELYSLTAKLLNTDLQELKIQLANNFKQWLGHNEPNYY